MARDKRTSRSEQNVARNRRRPGYQEGDGTPRLVPSLLLLFQFLVYTYKWISEAPFKMEFACSTLRICKHAYIYVFSASFILSSDVPLPKANKVSRRCAEHLCILNHPTHPHNVGYLQHPQWNNEGLGGWVDVFVNSL